MLDKLKISKGLDSFIDEFDALLLDAYGVFWAGNAFGPIEGTKESMKNLVKDGKIVGILSNTTSLGIKEKEKIAKWGFN
jgi:ribonucleotide monophosphatase NagD (HAD superfamily)